MQLHTLLKLAILRPLPVVRKFTRVLQWNRSKKGKRFMINFLLQFHTKRTRVGSMKQIQTSVRWVTWWNLEIVVVPRTRDGFKLTRLSFSFFLVNWYGFLFARVHSFIAYMLNSLSNNINIIYYFITFFRLPSFVCSFVRLFLCLLLIPFSNGTFLGIHIRVIYYHHKPTSPSHPSSFLADRHPLISSIWNV